MAEIPSVEQVASASDYLTRAAGITATVLAFVAIVTFIYMVWKDREHTKERADVRAELFGDKERGIRGTINEMWDRIEIMRKEEWANIDNMMSVLTEGLKALEDRRRQDSIAQFAKQDDQLDEVKNMSVADQVHHSKVEASAARVEGALREQTTRLSDMIALATKMVPAAWDRATNRRKKA